MSKCCGFFPGLPQPDVSWLKNKSSSKDLSFVVQNGSLVLRNVSRESAGTYTCVATNALGKAIAATVLWLAGKLEDPVLKTACLFRSLVLKVNRFVKQYKPVAS